MAGKTSAGRGPLVLGMPRAVLDYSLGSTAWELRPGSCVPGRSRVALVSFHQQLNNLTGTPIHCCLKRKSGTLHQPTTVFGDSVHTLYTNLLAKLKQRPKALGSCVAFFAHHSERSSRELLPCKLTAAVVHIFYLPYIFV